MSSNPFGQLLIEFKQAYAEFGEVLFGLAGLTYDEVCSDPEIYDSASCLGVVPLGEGHGGDQLVCEKGLQPVRGGYGGNGHGYYIFGRSSSHYASAYQAFRSLAAKAGASLPREARESILVLPCSPHSRWLAYMWWQNPPSEEDLTPPDGVNILCRPIWSAPFFQSIEAIEQGGLCTPDNKASRHDLQRGVQPKPPRKPSLPMNKKKAIEFIGGQLTEKKLTASMAMGAVRYTKLTRELYIFCREQFPGLPGY